MDTGENMTSLEEVNKALRRYIWWWWTCLFCSMTTDHVHLHPLQQFPQNSMHLSHQADKAALPTVGKLLSCIRNHCCGVRPVYIYPGGRTTSAKGWLWWQLWYQRLFLPQLDWLIDVVIALPVRSCACHACGCWMALCILCHTQTASTVSQSWRGCGCGCELWLTNYHHTETIITNYSTHSSDL